MSSSANTAVTSDQVNPAGPGNSTDTTPVFPTNYDQLRMALEETYGRTEGAAPPPPSAPKNISPLVKVQGVDNLWYQSVWDSECSMISVQVTGRSSVNLPVKDGIVQVPDVKIMEDGYDPNAVIAVIQGLGLTAEIAAATPESESEGRTPPPGADTQSAQPGTTPEGESSQAAATTETSYQEALDVVLSYFTKNNLIELPFSWNRNDGSSLEMALSVASDGLISVKDVITGNFIVAKFNPETSEALVNYVNSSGQPLADERLWTGPNPEEVYALIFDLAEQIQAQPPA